MEREWKEKIEPVILQGKIDLPLSYAPGKTAEAFFLALRDEGKILGKRCSECGKVLCPPRSVCPVCFEETGEWVELSGEGVLLNFTIVRRNFSHLPYPPPILFGVIKLDGADTNFVHIIGGIKPEEIKTGMRVKAVLKKERSGNILDILYFKPAKGG